MTFHRRWLLALPLCALPLLSASCAPDDVRCLRADDTVCDGRCVDLANNIEHCGACGATCDTFCDDGTCVELHCHDALDLLFVIDNSSSMREEQETFRTELPAFLRQLLGDGVTPPVFSSVRIGIVSSDMGASDTITSCGNPPGDDGILTRTAASSPCGATPAFFSFMGTPTTEASSSAACVADLGTSGCAFEQQLEAGLKALSPSSTAPWTTTGYTPPTFVVGAGHGGPSDANGGFVREDSVLAIFFLTDEEDCSTPTPSTLFGRDASSVNLNLRCFSLGEQRHPVARFVEGFAALRGSPSELVVGATVGIPPATMGMAYEAMLADPDMQETLDPSSSPPDRLLPACTSAGGRGVAFPPRRIVETLAGLEARGAYTSVSSICESSGYLDDFAATLVAARNLRACEGR